jgi:hypothetical protein
MTEWFGQSRCSVYAKISLGLTAADRKKFRRLAAESC